MGYKLHSNEIPINEEQGEGAEYASSSDASLGDSSDEAMSDDHELDSDADVPDPALFAEGSPAADGGRSRRSPSKRMQGSRGRRGAGNGSTALEAGEAQQPASSGGKRKAVPGALPAPKRVSAARMGIADGSDTGTPSSARAGGSSKSTLEQLLASKLGGPAAGVGAGGTKGLQRLSSLDSRGSGALGITRAGSVGDIRDKAAQGMVPGLEMGVKEAKEAGELAELPDPKQLAVEIEAELHKLYGEGAREWGWLCGVRH
jgi:hypothetical protein